jgi:hypothetical protein
MTVLPAVSIEFDGPVHDCAGCPDNAICDAETEGWAAGTALLARLLPVAIRTSRNPARVAEWLGRRGGFNCKIDMGVFRAARSSWDETGFLLVTARELPGLTLGRGEGIQPGYWQAALAAIGARMPPEVRAQALAAAAEPV